MLQCTIISVQTIPNLVPAVWFHFQLRLRLQGGDDALDLRQQQIADGQEDVHKVGNTLGPALLNQLVQSILMALDKVHDRIMHPFKIAEAAGRRKMELPVARRARVAGSRAAAEQSGW